MTEGGGTHAPERREPGAAERQDRAAAERQDRAAAERQDRDTAERQDRDTAERRGRDAGPRRNLLAEADARRDAGDWQGAAEAYAEHLATAPGDWAIWIQHGHAVKEAGDPAAALASYRRAEAIRPDDPDLQVQIGHALKQARDWVGARAAYGRALELDPLREEAWRGIAVLLHPSLAEAARAEPGGEAGGEAGAGAGTGAGAEPDAAAHGFTLLGDLRVVLDLSDLMGWWNGGARAPTGIQRIQMDVAGMALSRGATAAEARLAVYRAESGTWRELPPEAFRRLVGLARSGTDAAEPAWTETLALVRDLLERAPDLAFPEGGWLANLGSSWAMPGYHQALRMARAKGRLRYAALVHDMGPVLLPEHNEPAECARFARWFATLAMEADLLLAVSQATRRDMLHLAETALAGQRFPPVRVLSPDALPSAPPAAPAHPRAAELMAEPFILCVGTVESRKDHLFVLNAWLTLLRRHGDALPPLLLVGRAGFNAGPALALLRRAPALAGRVHRLEDAPDGLLAELYRRALFVIYHSRHEGWGLPVTEALAAGRAVATPAHSGLVEAGQGLALHYAAGSEPDFLALVERLAFDAGFRAAAEARVAAGLRLRGWRDVADELLGLLAEAPAADPGPPPAPPPGTVLRLGEIESSRPEPSMAWADLVRVGAGWHAPEPWGCWTRPGRALLRLPLPEGAGGPLRLHLALQAPGTPRSVQLRIGRGARLVVEVPAGSRRVAALDLPEAAGQIEVAIEVAPPPGADAATGIGVAALMACPPEDIAARIGFLERVTFAWPEPA